MKAIVFSIGEPTTELSAWSLHRLGFDVEILESQTSFWHKLRSLYESIDEDFIRVDADIIVNKNLPKLEPVDNCWWHQCYGWDWLKQDLIPIGINWIKKEALPYLRTNIGQFSGAERPESQMFRLEEFHNPRRCEVYNIVGGIHGYKQDDYERVRFQKDRRRQEYDWELLERINQL